MASAAVAPTAESGQDTSQSTLFPKLKAWVLDSINKHSDWYKEAEECFGYTAGSGFSSPTNPSKGQWPGDSAQKMIASGRQPIEFNRVGPIVDSICGLEVNNRQSIKFLPRTDGDVSVNERLSSLGDWARDETDAEDEESEMFRNAVICGRGFTETRIDFDEEPKGRIIIDSLDPLECGVDPSSRKACFVDARYLWRYRDMPTDEAEQMFPGVAVAALHASWAMQITPQDGGEGNKVDYPDEQRPGFAPALPPKIVRMVQIQWWERETRYLVAGPNDSEPSEISQEDYNSQADTFEGMGYKTQQVERRRYYQAILGRMSVLEEVEKSCFTIRACTGRWDRNKGYHYGVVRPCRDPQMLANKTLSQVLHIINTNAKGGILYEKGAFANAAKAEQDWSNPSKNVPLNEGGLAKIKDRTPPPISPGLAQLQEFSISSIRDVTGVSVELLGLADRDQPASLEYQRRQSAMTILASLFNGLRHYRKLQGRTLIETLKLLPPGVLVRVLINPQQAAQEYAASVMQWRALAAQAQQQGQQPPPPPEPPTAEFMKQTKRGEVFDPNAFGLGPDSEFDVIVDEMPSSPNQKDATWATIQPFIPEMPLPLLPAVLKYSPLPETAVEDLSNAIKQLNSGGDPQQAEMMQKGQQLIQQLSQENQSLKLKNQQLQSNSNLNDAKAMAITQDSETARMKAMSDHALGTGDLALGAMQQKLDLLTTAVGHLMTIYQSQQQQQQPANDPGAQ